MADAPLITIADAIASEINAEVASGTFNRAFEAAVLWDKRTLELAEYDVLRVDVAPINWAQKFVARGEWDATCRYHIGVRKRFGVSEQEQATGRIATEEITELVTLLADLLQFFMPKQPSQDGRELATVPDAVWAPEKDNSTEIVIKWSHLEEMRQFTGFFPLTYEVSI